MTLWLTGSEVVVISATRRARLDEVKEVFRRAISFTSRAEVDYNDDVGVTIDVHRVIGDKLRAGMRAEVEELGRFERRWMVHAALKDMSWLRDRRGQVYSFNGAEFARGLNLLGDAMSWATIQSVIVRFHPRATWQPNLW